MTAQQLHNWIRCYLITDVMLLECPLDLIAQLSRPLRKRYDNLASYTSCLTPSRRNAERITKS